MTARVQRVVENRGCDRYSTSHPPSISDSTRQGVSPCRWDNAGKPGDGWVWPAPTKSGHIDHSTLKKQHRQALKGSGMRAFVFYDLRHTFATRLGPHVDAWTLCKIMGWSSLSVAMRYIHPSADQVLEAISALGGHKIGHSEPEPESQPELSSPETTEEQGENWRALEDDFRTLHIFDGADKNVAFKARQAHLWNLRKQITRGRTFR
jgi:hypothetical protein